VSSTTPLADGDGPDFEITHPFHPQLGKRFDLLDERITWGESRVYTRDAEGHLKAYPVGWTSRAPEDPAVVLGGGRVHFRVTDLLEAAGMLSKRQASSKGRRR